MFIDSSGFLTGGANPPPPRTGAGVRAGGGGGGGGGGLDSVCLLSTNKIDSTRLRGIEIYSKVSINKRARNLRARV
jgi:hypothetical protein